MIKVLELNTNRYIGDTFHFVNFLVVIFVRLYAFTQSKK